MPDVFDAYVASLKRSQAHHTTEHTNRGALETLLRHFAETGDSRNEVIHEGGREGDKGAPDFKVVQSSMILGYVETKQVGVDLNRVLKSDQVSRYLELSDNLLVTDYLHFILLRKDAKPERATLAYAEDLAHPRFRPADGRSSELAALLEKFFSTAPGGIGSAEDLAAALAKRCRILRDDLTVELTRQEREKDGGRLIGLYGVFKDQVFHDLKLEEFADAFAQTLGYGVFLAKYNARPNESVTLSNVERYVPASFELIRELVDFLKVLDQANYASIRWVVEEILSLINGLDLAALHKDLSFGRRSVRRGVKARSEDEARLFERDPYIYFYEDFLKRYDAETREARGVYYTPPPVVNFIVRAIDDILMETFGIRDGLGDHENVTVLDFACGTGTFMVEIFEQVLTRIGAGSGKADLIVRDHLLKNIFGFEYLIAPYTIAHLKLSQYLADKQHPLKAGERLQVFLTNTLEPVSPTQSYWLPALSAESRKAQSVKEKPILVITGNPPYSGESRNKGKWISRAIDAYKQVDGKPLGEKNPKWLNDDYVKFIRFAQMKMDGGVFNVFADDGSVSTATFAGVEQGVVGIITNHAFLDNPTFRGMRQSLMNSFDRIYVLDLHGNSNRKETAPDGSKDENVFDIRQGVAISLFIKTGRKRDQSVYHSDLWGPRLEKYKAVAEASIQSVGWTRLTPVSPDYLLIPQDKARRVEFDSGWPIASIFPVNSVGIVTARDALSIHFDRESAWSTVKDFLRLSVDDARVKYSLGRDVQDWTVALAQEDLRRSGPDRRNIIPLTYRPLDTRFAYYTGRSRGFMCRPRAAVMNHMHGDNIAIATNRSQEIPGEWTNVLACSTPITHHSLSLKEVNYLFPLYRSPSLDEAEFGKESLFANLPRHAGEARVENISKDFRGFVDGKYHRHIAPEAVLGYVYAVLHASSYRSTFAEFLRIDFPRIPFCDSRPAFEKLSTLGWTLIQAHILKDVPRLGLGAYRGKGDNEVDKPAYAEGDRKIFVNRDQYFEHVPEAVWNFHIGGYQVLAKYLKDRRGRTLSLVEIETIENVVNALAFTIRQRTVIDAAYLAAFGAG